MIKVDNVVIRTDTDTGKVQAILYTPDDDRTNGQEAIGDDLVDALSELAVYVEEALC